MRNLLTTALCGLLTCALSAQKGKDFKFEITTIGGQSLDQDDFKNNVVIVDFWGTWCRPCRDAVPSLTKLYGKYKHHGLEIIGLNYKERGDAAKVRKTIRDFAAEHGITYTLALGTAAIRDQVDDFAGYPTMLFFKKGMQFDHLTIGFKESHAADMEAWVRRALGLDEAAEAGSAEEEDAAPSRERAEKPDEPKPGKIPEGVIYKPGKNDTGFAFKAKGVDGQAIDFADYRGKRVVLVVTSSWDGEARQTAELLNELQAAWGDKDVAILAASFEQARKPEDKRAALRKFLAEVKATYGAFPVGLPFLKKIHEPSGLPMYFVFDANGKLILRRRANTKKRIRAAVDRALGKRP
jgi:thiol-disulfide isomerase/thioredoxin